MLKRNSRPLALLLTALLLTTLGGICAAKASTDATLSAQLTPAPPSPGQLIELAVTITTSHEVDVHFNAEQQSWGELVPVSMQKTDPVWQSPHWQQHYTFTFMAPKAGLLTLPPLHFHFAHQQREWQQTTLPHQIQVKDLFVNEKPCLQPIQELPWQTPPPHWFWLSLALLLLALFIIWLGAQQRQLQTAQSDSKTVSAQQALAQISGNDQGWEQLRGWLQQYLSVDPLAPQAHSTELAQFSARFQASYFSPKRSNTELMALITQCNQLTGESHEL